MSTKLVRAGRVLVLLTAMLLTSTAIHRCGLSFNISDSMPVGFYHLERLNSSVRRGTVVESCLPAAVATVGRRLDYLPAGSCPGGAAPVLKIVAAVAGDRLELLDGKILVNGRALRGSATAQNDAHGRKLAHVAHGAYALRQGEVWLWSPNPASWDSRYYGPVSERRILGRANLLFPLGRWNFGKTGP